MKLADFLRLVKEGKIDLDNPDKYTGYLVSGITEIPSTAIAPQDVEELQVVDKAIQDSAALVTSGGLWAELQALKTTAPTGVTPPPPAVQPPSSKIFSKATPYTVTNATGRKDLYIGVIPLGTLKENGSLDVQFLLSCNVTSASKKVRLEIAGQCIYEFTLVNVGSTRAQVSLFNRGVLTSQVGGPYFSSAVTGGFAGVSTAGASTFSIDFSKDVSVRLVAELSAPTEKITLEYIRATVIN